MILMRVAALTIALFVVSAMADERLALIQPKASKLVSAERSTNGDIRASFTSQTMVVSTLVARWWPREPDDVGKDFPGETPE